MVAHVTPDEGLAVALWVAAAEFCVTASVLTACWLWGAPAWSAAGMHHAVTNGSHDQLDVPEALRVEEPCLFA